MCIVLVIYTYGPLRCVLCVLGVIIVFTEQSRVEVSNSTTKCSPNRWDDRDNIAVYVNSLIIITESLIRLPFMEIECTS